MVVSTPNHAISIGKTQDSPHQIQWSDTVQKGLESRSFRVDHFVRGAFLAARYNPESKAPFSAYSTDALHQFRYAPTHLVNTDGKFIETPSTLIESHDYVVMQSITHKHLESGVHHALISFLEAHNNQLPQKLMIPYAASEHTAFLVIEPKEDQLYISVIDSNGFASFDSLLAIDSAKGTLLKVFPDKSVIANRNLNRQSEGSEYPNPCSFHLMEDIQSITQITGTVYETVEDENSPKEFPNRSEKEVGDLIVKYSQMSREYFVEMLREFPNAFQLNLDGKVTALTPENYQTIQF